MFDAPHTSQVRKTRYPLSLSLKAHLSEESLLRTLVSAPSDEPPHPRAGPYLFAHWVHEQIEMFVLGLVQILNLRLINQDDLGTI